MIHLTCAQCGMQAVLPESAAGKFAKCRCGHINPVPIPVGMEDAGRGAGQAPPEDDLAPQGFDVPAPVDANAPQASSVALCESCHRPLAAGETICAHCGYRTEADTSLKRSDRAERNKAFGRHLVSRREISWWDFVSAAWSAQVCASLVLLIARAIGAYVVLFGGVMGVIFFLIGVGPFLPPEVVPILGAVLVLGLAVVCVGLVVKEPFAVCEAACEGYAAPQTNKWNAGKSGALYMAICLVPVLPSVALYIQSGDWKLAGLVGTLVGFLITPLAFVSVAQAGGSWLGLSPARLLQWLFRLFVPYLAVVSLSVVNVAAAISIFVTVAALVGWPLDPEQWAGQNLGMRFGMGLLLDVLLLHPLMNLSVMLGLMYRKFGKGLQA